MKKSETKKWFGLFLAFAVTVTTAFSPAPFSYAAGEGLSKEGETPPVTVSGDVGQYAAVSASGISAWEEPNGINLDWEPEASNLKGTNSWGNYGCAPDADGHWVRYDWSKAVKTSSMQIYWYDDNGGLRVPKELKIQYLDVADIANDNAVWKDVEMTTDYSSAKELNQYNVINFNEITAISIRLLMTLADAPAGGTGIHRWKVMGGFQPLTEEQIYEMDKKKLTLPAWVGEDFNLPAVTASGKALTWESSDTSVIKIEGDIAKVTKGKSEKTVKVTAKLNGKAFKEFFITVAKRELLQDATVEIPFQKNAWWDVEYRVIDGVYTNWANANNAIEEAKRNTIQLNFARKLSLTSTKVYWHAIPEGESYYAVLPEGVTLQYLKNEVSPDDAASWEDIELEAAPTFTEALGDTYTFKDTVNTTKLRMKIAEGSIDNVKKSACIMEWEVFGDEYVDQTDITAANAVKAKIEALGEVAYTEAFKAKLDEARTMYDALTDTQKGLLEDVYKTLTDAEDAYANLAAAAASRHYGNRRNP